MKTKFLLILCFLVTCVIKTIAKKKDIHISQKWIGEAKHSKAILPSISYDGNILYVESTHCIPCITISVKNIETEDVVYEETTSINGEMSFFTNIIDGMYEIEMTIGDKVYVGQFEIGDEYEREDSIGECL